MTNRLKIELQRIRLNALLCLTHLRSYEYSGTTLQTNLTILEPPYPVQDTSDWSTVHRTTLEELLRFIFIYYRRLHDVQHLKEAVRRLFAEEMPDHPPHPANITFEETHEVTEPRYQAPSLDVRALEMMSVDMLVDQIYMDPLILRDPLGFATRVPILCEYFRTPLFHSTQRAFYRLVINAFDQHPNRGQVVWPTSSPVIHQVSFVTSTGGTPIIGQISSIHDPFS